MGTPLKDLLAESRALRTQSGELRRQLEGVRKHSHRILADSARLLVRCAALLEESDHSLRMATDVLEPYPQPPPTPPNPPQPPPTPCPEPAGRAFERTPMELRRRPKHHARMGDAPNLDALTPGEAEVWATTMSTLRSMGAPMWEAVDAANHVLEAYRRRRNGLASQR